MQHSTGYIIGFAIAVCLVCAFFVSLSAVGLKDRQDANKLLDRQMKVLTVAGMMEDGASLPRDEVTALETVSTRSWIHSRLSWFSPFRP